MIPRSILRVLLGLSSSACSVVPTFEPVNPADAIVVLGNRPPVDVFGNVRPETRRRVEAGVELYRRGLAPILLMSGGKSGGFVEAKVMRDLAVELGVPADAVWMEDESLSTITNARNSVRLLRRKLQRRTCSLILVSSPYHLERARRLFTCAGADVQISPAAVPDSVAYSAGFTLYEWWVRGIYLFIDDCGRAHGDPEYVSYDDVL